MDFSDLSASVRGFSAQDPSQRARLVSCVREVHERSAAVIEAVFRGAWANTGSSVETLLSPPPFDDVLHKYAANASLFFINGDHNQMTAAVAGFVGAQVPRRAAARGGSAATEATTATTTAGGDGGGGGSGDTGVGALARGDFEFVRPIVVSVDLHSDARPTQDGPHSGTWCSEVSE